jgi:two-component system sensor histidine kinase KdpD
VVGVALVGGLLPALLAAVGGSMLLNYYFVPPLHRFTIAEGNNLLALLVFLAVAVTVSSVVDLAARKTSQAARATAEAEMLSTLAGSVLRGDQALPALLAQVRETFGLSSVALVERAVDGDQDRAGEADHRGWRVVGSVGPDPCRRPEDADTDLPVSQDLALVLRGRSLPAADRRVLAAFAVQAAVALRQQRLAEAAAEAGPLAEADRTRRALLAAVSHDLRSPLAAASAAVANLGSDEVAWTADERAELLSTAQESLDRLAWLVENLLDMSRLQAGRLSVFLAPVGLDDVIPGALRDLGPAADSVVVTVPDDLPLVRADPALLERVIANLLSNAARYAPPEHPPLVAASALGDHVEVRVVDRGPGLSEKDREQVFTPFQRLGDRDNSTGIGLGLALSRGLTEAMGGTLTPEDTPGGGLTMVVTLPATLDDHPPVPTLDDDQHAASSPEDSAIKQTVDVV